MLLFIRYLELILLHLPNFNTSHVTVYLNHRVHHNHYLRFQYISCYCLSKTSKAIGGKFWNFNTSHVTVYRAIFILKKIWINFNTSHVTVYQKAHSKKFDTLKFQYISCYCLSTTICRSTAADRLFQYISCYCLSALLLAISWYPTDFNTSHVTVYLFCFEGKSNQTVISIHLMLLFIVVILYNLSSYLNFNTSHVTVYRQYPI